MVWNKEAECMEKEEKEKLQLKRLKETVKKAYNNVPLYKEKMDSVEVKPEDIKSLKDIEKLPFTDKADLRAAYPFKNFAVPDEEIVEIHTSSGTTGKPTVSGYTEKDIDIWGEIVARAIGMALGEKKDKIQNCYGYGLFTGGLGIHHGAHKFGATVIPISAGNTKKQIEVMIDFQSSIISCTPSYAMYLAETLEKEGYSSDDINLKSGIFGAEMWTEEMRNELEKKLGITALNIYGLTEIMGPGVAQECPKKNGLHISDDHFYPEVINPDTGEVLGNDEKGELVLTTLTREGMPILRFRTKDITTLRGEKCACGRTLVRMDRITGRTDDMLKIRGVLIFPSQIETALLKIKGISPNYQIVVTRPDYLDELEVKVEASSELFSDEIKEMELAENKIASMIKKEIGLRVEVTLCEPGSLPRSEGKAVRVIDKRNFE
ncbi:phenylacetate--CoA ligase family protein [Methanobrevibacter sp. DSM 116169]|uniref:phenylacetate--CoA ligase family protein n=1 Tax=Methanobrevibacter sp. DSM 116169 TaxID=3242727 RepID=UPI0038FC0FF8